MAELLKLPSFYDERGGLTVLEKTLPFDIKRVYWIYGADGCERGGHRHHLTKQAAVCVHGRCEVLIKNQGSISTHILDAPNICMILAPEDWHVLKNITHEAVIMVFASKAYDPQDYIVTPL